ncbi:MAG: sodium-dependent transporter, partial [Victivallales bacterium]|nr:sodium-dependent transporter [Victivallales bacterium]
MAETSSRETLATRLGFILLSAGCAIGLGNVWRFPFIVGQYGGGIFVFLYIFFLLILGFPIMMAEMAIGRGGHSNLVGSFRNLASSHKTAWTWLARIMISGCLILMIYYTTVSGWLFSYSGYYLRGTLTGAEDAAATGGFFNGLLASPVRSLGYMILAIALGTLVCWFGVQKGVENCVKYMMTLLLALMILLAVYALFTPGAKKGLEFYLKPDWNNFIGAPLETLFAAMGQAFFTLSLGVGSMTIFGSYLSWKKSLAVECIWIIVLDTFVALCAGLIVFPICKSYGIDAAQGPGLMFVSLPVAFNAMPLGRFWGSLFFLFMSLAALTTIVAVFENLIAYLQDEHGIGRKAATLIVGAGVAILSLPCVFGYNLLSGIHPLGNESTILDFEDFIVSQNLLPLGALALTIFCFSKAGWGKDKFIAEVEEGQQWRFPKAVIHYWRYAIPLIILVIFVMGYYN